MKIQYFAELEEAPEGGYSVTFPDIEEAITEGETLEEALFNASEALDLSLEQRLIDKEDIPLPSKKRGKKFHLITPSAAVQSALLVRFNKDDKTIADLARMLNTSWPAASRLESPKHTPNIKNLEKTAKLLGKTLVIAFE
jgi:antitoxin HicB